MPAKVTIAQHAGVDAPMGSTSRTSCLQSLLLLTKTLRATLLDDQSACASAYAGAWADLAASLSYLEAYLTAFSASLTNPDDLSAIVAELHDTLGDILRLFSFTKSLGALRALVFEVTILTKLQFIIKELLLGLRRVQDAALHVCPYCAP